MGNGGVDKLTTEFPSWTVILKKSAGLERGQGSVYYREEYRPPRDNYKGGGAAVEYKLLSKKGRNLKYISGGSISVVPKRGKYGYGQKAWGFLFFMRGGTRAKGPLHDGICLNCQETNPFVLQHDHALGLGNSDFFITLCANCHQMKTSKRFWLSEWTLK